MLLLPAIAIGQGRTAVTPKELAERLDRSAALFQAEDNYRVRTTIMAYRNTGDATPQETEVSTVWKMGAMAKAEHMGLVSYQNERLRVTVVPEERVLMVAEPQSFFDVLGKDYKLVVFSGAERIERWPKDGRDHYRAYFRQGSDHEQLEFAFDDAGWLRRLECWWGYTVPLDPDNALSARVTPKVVMEMERPVRLKPGEVNADPALAVVVRGHELVPTAAYSGYEIVDNRLNP
jgi:hypothetical protein